MARLVVLLQNAWSTLWTEDWHRPSWLRALRACHTGKRLNRLLGHDWSDIHVDNTTSKVGDDPSSKLPPEPEYVLRMLAEHDPQAVVACGEQARDVAVQLWRGKILAIPHPAYKMLTNKLLDEGNRLLRTMDFDRLHLKQCKGRFDKDALPALMLATPAAPAASQTEKGKDQ